MSICRGAIIHTHRTTGQGERQRKRKRQQKGTETNGGENKVKIYEPNICPFCLLDETKEVETVSILHMI